MTANRNLSLLNRSIGAALLVLMVIGALGLWIGIPVAILWGLGKLVDRPAEHLVLALLAVPSVMALFAVLLTRLNRLYLRVNGFDLVPVDTEEWAPRVRGPLDRILAACAVIAAVALLSWMLFSGAPTGNVPW
jgi:amino acid transporter